MDCRPNAVLFDYDGVLVSSEAIHSRAWRQLLEEIGLPVDLSLITRNLGRISPEILTHLLDAHRPGWSSQEYDIAQLARRKNELYLEAAQNSSPAERLQLFRHVPAALERLRAAGVRMAIVSNGRRREVEATAMSLGIWSYFELVVTRDGMAQVKPHPLPYQLAASRLGLFPEQCASIEDSPPGLVAAILAGTQAYAVRTHLAEEDLHGATLGRPELRPRRTFADLSEFAAFILVGA